MIINKFKLFGLIIIILALSSAHVNAQEMTGKMLARKVFDRNRGKNSFSTELMVLVSKNGNKRIRQFITKRLLENGLERTMIRFTAPADINGTGFLTIEQPGWKTEQFLYLPALRRTRRIVSSQKSSRFVNSDFTYEDMERHSVDNYTYKIIGHKTVSGIAVYTLESRPKKGIQSQYSLTISQITEQSFVPLNVEFFDKKKRHIKTYKVLKLKKIQGIWTESMLSMENLKKKHKTYIKLKNITYNTDINKDMLSRKSLENY